MVSMLAERMKSAFVPSWGTPTFYRARRVLSSLNQREFPRGVSRVRLHGAEDEV